MRGRGRSTRSKAIPSAYIWAENGIAWRQRQARSLKAIQLHTGGMCHLDADMTRQGLDGLDTGGVELAILENVDVYKRQVRERVKGILLHTQDC